MAEGNKKLWGQAGGKDVFLVTLKSDALEVDISSYGGALVSVRVKTGGKWIDVCLGYESLERYIVGGQPNFGTLVGRCANRIANGTFEIEGKEYQLVKNDGPNHLHGGPKGFWTIAWDLVNLTDTAVTFTFSEPDGHMGYPGKVDITVKYEVRNNEFHMEYSGVTDKPTILSLTNHAYWNLKGHDAGDALDHKVSISGSKRTAVGEDLIITGELSDVEGTDHDFRGEPRSVRAAFDKVGSFDSNYCLDAEAATGKAPAAKLVGPNGVTMEVWTDAPGIQFFSGENLSNPKDPEGMWVGKGTKWEKYGALCLETQLWPDGIHHKHFPSPILLPGQTYQHHTWHIFTAP